MANRRRRYSLRFMSESFSMPSKVPSKWRAKKGHSSTSCVIRCSTSMRVTSGIAPSPLPLPSAEPSTRASCFSILPPLVTAGALPRPRGGAGLLSPPSAAGAPSATPSAAGASPGAAASAPSSASSLSSSLSSSSPSASSSSSSSPSSSSSASSSSTTSPSSALGLPRPGRLGGGGLGLPPASARSAASRLRLLRPTVSRWRRSISGHASAVSRSPLRRALLFTTKSRAICAEQSSRFLSGSPCLSLEGE
mmetsp:Transcript_22313/g.56584  ORF Transcript_22313/g.56584 Transcript_22313/m.56584 type:complete len:250 (+) Transcript_22313:823-1572(+)